MTTTEPGADELRAQAWLRNRGVGPSAAPPPDSPADSRPDTADTEPITPTRVIPAADWPTPRPAATGSGAAPPGPPPPPPWPPDPLDSLPLLRRDAEPVHVTVDPIRVHVVLGMPEPEPPTWADRLQLRRNLRCLAAGFAPAGLWARALTACWHQAGLSAAWTLAGLAVVVAAAHDQRQRGRAPATTTDRGRGTWLTRTALCTALLGAALGLPLFGTLTTLVTGVHP
jgi:hypothetical protein